MEVCRTVSYKRYDDPGSDMSSFPPEVLAVVVGLGGRLDLGDGLGVAVERPVAPDQQPGGEGGRDELRDARRLAAGQPPAVGDRPPTGRVRADVPEHAGSGDQA